VRALCDRRRGIGADGVLGVVRRDDADVRWFMDYRNADGSIAEMCGNGARLFARYLVDAGWASPGRIDFVTRGGMRAAELGDTGDVLIHMGPVRLGSSSTVVLGGDELSGVAVDVGNPHLVCLIDTDPLEVDLAAAPQLDPAMFPDGANVEVVQPLREDAVRMRVHERGVGETRSCGTGTVAAAAAFLASQHVPTGTVRVQVLGGTVTVGIGDGTSTLTGPAVIVASGSLEPGALPGVG
jgi:diaminopimelate epimerase